MCRGLPAYSRGLELGDLKGPLKPKPFYGFYVHANICICDVWKCAWGHYFPDIFTACLHLSLSHRCLRVTFFFLSQNDEAHSWISCNLMLDLRYLNKDHICFVNELNLWVIIAAKICSNGHLEVHSLEQLFFGPLFVMVNGFSNCFYLKLCQIFIIRSQTTWTLLPQKRAEMNQKWKQSTLHQKKDALPFYIDGQRNWERHSENVTSKKVCNFCLSSIIFLVLKP